MKKIILILTIIFLILPIIPKMAFGQTPSNAPTAASTQDDTSNNNDSSSDPADQKIDQIKDKVASKVAKLKLVEKRGVVGVVDSVSGNEIKINDLNDNTRIVDVDELTKYSSEDNPDFDISNIKKGTKVSVIGLYNKDSERLLARFVNEISIPLFLNGVISGKDAKNYTINLTTDDGKDYTVDIENVTKSFSFSDGELNPSGFSKLEPMQNAIVIGFPDPKKENEITASRIITFPNVPRNPRIDVVTPAPSEKESPTPSKAK